MVHDKTPVAYATKGGVTQEAAYAIAEVLREKYKLEIDMVNLRKNVSPDLAQYRNVIIGSGVRMQKPYKEFLKFLEKDFANKNVGIFLSSGEAVDPKTHDQAITKYITNVLAKYPHVKPIASEAFGGRITVMGKTISDGRDMQKVRIWAEELGKRIT